MAKTLKDFLEGYLKVKSADEQKFIDKHVTAKNPDRNGNGDDVFKGNTKPIDRRATRKGYNPGEDEKVYEEAEQADEAYLVVPRKDNLVSLKQHSFGDSKLKGGQKKLDKNKNGKLDKQDFKILRKEEAEQIDERWSENSKKTSKNLAAAALDVGNVATGGLLSKSKLAKKAMKWADSPDETTSKSGLKAYQARQARKTNEEAEQIDELSNRMLKSYAKKANKQGVKIARTGVSKAPGNEDQARKLANRQDGEELARTKLAMRREEAEQIDELDRQLGGTLSRYINKTKDNEKREKGRNLALSKRWGDTKYGTPEPKVKGVDRFKEEAAQIDEGGYSAKAGAAGKDLGKPGKNFAKIANKAAAKYGTKASGERVAGAVLAKLRKEEKLAELISDLSESHQRTMTNVFEKLNEDNKTKFLEACDTPEGVEKMLDFAINNRGE